MMVTTRNRRRLRFPALLLLGMAASSLGPVASAQRSSQSVEPPTRIVSIGSDITEIVFALGAGDLVVATDTTSSFPLAATKTKKVGYLRNLATEGLLSLEPDLLLFSSAAGPASTLRQLSAIGVRSLHAPKGYSLDTVRQKITLVGQAIGQADSTRELINKYQLDVAKLRRLRAGFQTRPSVAFLLSVSHGSAQVAGLSTAAQAVIELIGARNVFEHQKYKAVSAEVMLERNPDYILMMTQSIEREGGIESILAGPVIALTDAGKRHQLIGVDGVALLSFGPRVAAAAYRLAKKIRPTRYDK